LWLFWLAPLAGAGLAGVAYRVLGGEQEAVLTPAPVTKAAASVASPT
jgi:hypothetical protein